MCVCDRVNGSERQTCVKERAERERERQDVAVTERERVVECGWLVGGLDEKCALNLIYEGSWNARSLN